VHITLRVAKDVGNLRTKRAHQIVRAGLAGGRERAGFRLVHYSVQSNHLHLLVEADSADALSRGIKGLQIRLARSLNKLYGRTGRLFSDRYHAHVLKTPREVRHALAYVLLNARKHLALAGLDPCSSGLAFDGWKTRIARSVQDVPVVTAKSWLLRIGWRKHGLIAMDETLAC
jgi:REP element-mobilizing transposase RayT